MNKQETLAQRQAALESLAPFLPRAEKEALSYALKGEEGEAIAKLVTEWRRMIDAMPVTYDQDGKGDDAIAYLHYFHGGSDWFITEKDASGDGRAQAFGFACLNGDTQNAEYGYCDIAELVGLGVELDLYWLPQSIAECKKRIHAKESAPC